MTRGRSRAAEATLVALATIGAVAVFFRAAILSGFTRLFGDRYDGFIEIALMQHWSNVLHGLGGWRDTGYFHPHAGTLGYNDGYLLLGLPYAIFRALGCDWALSATFARMCMKAVGAIGMYLLMRRPIGCRIGYSLLAAVIFTIANGLAVQAVHGQLDTIALAPVEAYLLGRFVNALPGSDRWAARGWGVAAAILFAAWIMTAYYMAWFFVFLATMTVVAGLLMLDRARRDAIARVGQREWRTLLVTGGVLAAASVPFLLVYAATAQETGMHPWPNAKFYAPPLIDTINVGPGNLLWGDLFLRLRAFAQPGAPIDHEFISGVSPLLLICALAGMAASFRSGWPQPYRWLAVASLVTWALALRFGSASGWKAVFYLFPGAEGLRVIARYQLFLLLPLIVFAVRWLDRVRGRIARIAAIAAGLFIVAEQLNAGDVSHFDRPAELAAMAAVPPLPPSCASFYIVTARHRPYPHATHDDTLYPQNTDAMLVSALQAAPTVNGFSTFNPPDWDFARSAAADYRARVRRYARRHGLRRVCVLDRARGSAWALDVP